MSKASKANVETLANCELKGVAVYVGAVANGNVVDPLATDTNGMYVVAGRKAEGQN